MSIDSAAPPPPPGTLAAGVGADRSAPVSSGRNRPHHERAVLGSLPTGNRITGEQALARSRIVRRLRLILPIIAFGLLVAFLWRTGTKEEQDARLDDLTLDGVVAKEAVMTNPSFAGQDDDGQPFAITAASAQQDPTTEEVINLDTPRATLQDGVATTLATAKHGIYSENEKRLILTEDVFLEREIQGRTYVLRSPEATLTLNDEVVTSNSGVTGSTHDGSLSADSMRVFNEERRVIFEGNVRMKFEPSAVKSLSKTLAADKTKTPVSAKRPQKE